MISIKTFQDCTHAYLRPEEPGHRREKEDNYRVGGLSGSGDSGDVNNVRHCWTDERNRIKTEVFVHLVVLMVSIG